jgi:hypothetical protein
MSTQTKQEPKETKEKKDTKLCENLNQWIDPQTLEKSENHKKKMVIVIAGPAGSGKSQTALWLLQKSLQKQEAQLFFNAHAARSKLLTLLVEHAPPVLFLTVENVLALPSWLQKRIDLIVFQEFVPEYQTTCCELGCFLTIEDWKLLADEQMKAQANLVFTPVCVDMSVKKIFLCKI